MAKTGTLVLYAGMPYTQIMRKKRRWLLPVSLVVLTIGLVGGWLLFTTQHGSSAGISSGPSQDTPIPPPDTLACIEALPDDVLIAQKLMFAGYSDQIGGQAVLLGNANLGGVIVMDETSPEAIKTLTSAFSITPLLAVDQEGGTVQRYTEEGILPGATAMAGSYTPEQAYQKYLFDAQYLKNVGLTTNFAPVVDVASRTPSPLPGRLYASDPAVATTYATQAIKAAQAAGITPVIKHFPGLGSATGNTDFESATTDPLSALKTRDLLPYKRLASFRPDVMVSSAIVPELTDGQPAVWSAAAVTLLRSYGYTNSVVYSDSLTAAALPAALDDATVKAWRAGIDVALIVQGREQTAEIHATIQAITAKVTTATENGELDRKDIARSVKRIFARKGIDACETRF